MEIKSASISKMYMHINADDYRAKGNVDLYYTDMKVNLLKRDEKADTLKKKGFLSFFANTFLPNDNPKKNGKFRKGPINVIREPHTSFFGLLWKCCLDGTSSAMTGIDQNKEKPDENIAIKVFKATKKPDRKSRKKKLI